MILELEDEAMAYVATFTDGEGIARLEKLATLLIEENEQQNLIAKASVPSIWLRHMADSAQLLDHVSRETSQPCLWLDLGTGAGFPGLVVAALRPEWDVRLVESRRRRVEWLEHARLELGLPLCSVLGSRLELVDNFHADVISARAFAPMPKLLDLSARFSTADTLWLLPKGRSATQDLNQLPESKRKKFHVEQSCTDPEAGIIVGRLQQKVGKRS